MKVVSKGVVVLEIGPEHVIMSTLCLNVEAEVSSLLFVACKHSGWVVKYSN